MTAQRRTAGAATAMAVAAVGAAIETAAAQAPDDLYVLQVHYEIVLEQETGTGAVAETVRETGTHHVSPDGRIRWDRRPVGEEALFEIHHPDGVRIVADPSLSSPWWNPASHRERRGARLTRREEGAYWAYATDEQRRQAGCIAARMQRGPPPRAVKRAIVRGPGFPSVVPPFSDGENRSPRSVGNLGVGPGQEALGTRVVEGLELEGLRQVDTHAGRAFVAETWFYFPESVFTPILAEHRTGGDGTFHVQRITGVTNAYVPADRFTVPDDYTRMESPNLRRRAVPR